jgi:hypothetical protein
MALEAVMTARPTALESLGDINGSASSYHQPSGEGTAVAAVEQEDDAPGAASVHLFIDEGR